MKRARIKMPPVVSIRFYDHSACTGDSAEIAPLSCEIIGYLVHEDKLFYRVVCWITDDNLSNVNNEGYAILKSTVISKRFL